MWYKQYGLDPIPYTLTTTQDTKLNITNDFSEEIGDKEIVFKDMKKVLYEFTEDPKSEPTVEELCETHRMQLTSISVASFGYWKIGDSINSDYDTVALRDVARLYSKYSDLYKFKSSIFYELYKWFN